MVKFTAEELRAIMDKKNNIRNVSVIAHADHGKSTLTESLAAAAGIIAQEVAGDVRMTDTVDEAERGITIKSTGISLYYEMTDKSLKNYKGQRDGNEYLINLIDSPGHVDFLSEMTAALCITDGALVVVDCIEGVCGRTETVLRQALGERIRPVLTVNKMDRCFLELQVEGEEAYQTFSRVIENANVIMATYEDKLLGDVQVYPEKGTVAFSAGLHDWAFTLTNFAKMYASKFGVDETKMMERLWGENFFDPATKKWTTNSTGSATCKRGFVQFCYEPIKQIIKTCMNDQKDKLWPMLQKLNVTMKSDEKELIGKALMKRVMQTWLPASTALLEMMIFHLPSPATAQKYRVENLYDGPLDDIYATAIRNCDPEGPLMLYVSKMIPASDKGRFFAFGRVFSGKVATGMKVRIMGPNYVPGQKKDLYVKSVQRTVIWMGKKQKSVEDVPCGNTVGLDQFITKKATLTNEDKVDACPIRAMEVSVSPAVVPNQSNDSFSPFANFPDDLLQFQIFSRLLPKSFFRCGSLCKKFYAASTDRTYLHKRYDGQKQSPLILLTSFEEIMPVSLIDALDLQSLDTRKMGCNPLPDCLGKGHKVVTCFKLLGSCKGVLMFSFHDDIFLCNPILKHWCRIPYSIKPHEMLFLYHCKASDAFCILKRSFSAFNDITSYAIMEFDTVISRWNERTVCSVRYTVVVDPVPVQVSDSLFWIHKVNGKLMVSSFDTVSKRVSSLSAPPLSENLVIFGIVLLDIDGKLGASVSWTEFSPAVTPNCPTHITLWSYTDNTWESKMQIAIPFRDDIVCAKHLGIEYSWTALICNEEGQFLVSTVNDITLYDKNGLELKFISTPRGSYHQNLPGFFFKESFLPSPTLPLRCERNNRLPPFFFALPAR